jgi:YVTN family beta-propeller protein
VGLASLALTPDSVAGTVVATIPVGKEPLDVAYHGGNGYVYVANANCVPACTGAGSVSVLSGTRVVDTLQIGDARGMAYNSGNGYLYVTNTMAATISVLSGTTVVARLPVGYNPVSAAYDSANGNVYVANYNQFPGSVSVISGTTVVATIRVGLYPSSVAYNSRNGYLYVANSGSTNMSLISGTAVVATVPLASIPEGVAYDSGNGYVYVSSRYSNSVTVIDGTTVLATVPVGNSPYGVAYANGNGYIYVANMGSNTVSVISEMAVVATIPVGLSPFGLAYDSVNRYVYVTNADSNTVSVISTIAPPTEPRNLAASGWDGRVTLSWEAPSLRGSDPITNYRIYRGTTAGSESLWDTVGNILSYSDRAVTNGQTYYYQVTAVSSAGESLKSTEASAMPQGVPSAPQGLTATAGNRLVTLNWQAPASNGGAGVTKYTLYRSPTSGAETALVTVPDVLTYTDSGLTNGQTYYYKVTANNSVGEGARSGEASATPSVPTTAPSAPQAPVATAGHGQVTLTWAGPSSTGGSAIRGYKVYRGTSPGYENLVQGLGLVLTYSDTGLANGQTYYYQVSALNGVGEGPRSEEVYATPTPVPDTTPPTVLITSPADNSALTSTNATVTGTASDDGSVQKVEISLDGTTWSLASGTTSWSAKVVLKAGANTIYVRATDGSGNQKTERITVTVQAEAVQASGFPLTPTVLAGILIVSVAGTVTAATARRRRRRPTSRAAVPRVKR